MNEEGQKLFKRGLKDTINNIWCYGSITNVRDLLELGALNWITWIDLRD